MEPNTFRAKSIAIYVNSKTDLLCTLENIVFVNLHALIPHIVGPYALDPVCVSADSQCECTHHRIVRTDPFGDKHIFYISYSFLLSSFDWERCQEPVPQTYAYLYGIINLIKIKKKSITKHQIMHSEQNQFSAWHILLSLATSLLSPALTVGYYSWINKRFVVVALCVSIVCSAETCEFPFLIFFSFFLLHLFMHCRV